MIPLLYCFMRLRLCKSLQFCLSPSFCQFLVKQPCWLLFSSHIDKMCSSLHDQLMVSFLSISDQSLKLLFLKPLFRGLSDHLWECMKKAVFLFYCHERKINICYGWEHTIMSWKSLFWKKLVYSDLDTWVYYKKKWDWKKEVELNLGSHLNYRCCER